MRISSFATMVDRKATTGGPGLNRLCEGRSIPRLATHLKRVAHRELTHSQLNSCPDKAISCSSSKDFAMSCVPKGNPFECWPVGTEIAGTPARLA